MTPDLAPLRDARHPAFILGISAFGHDSAAALLRDGVIVAAAQEERFTRRKGDADFPRHAVAYCLRHAGLTVADLAGVAFYERPREKFERLLETWLAFAPRGWRFFRRALPVWAREKLWIPEDIRSILGEEFRGPLWCADHHESHAASAFFPSPYREAAILTLDAVGTWGTSGIGIGRDERITLLEEIRFPHSLGMLYTAFTYYAGFKVNSGEYKLMGLAPYGTPRYVNQIRDRLIELHPDGSVWLDMNYFDFCTGGAMTSERFHSLFGGPPRSPEGPITRKEMDLAASIQKICDEVVLNSARHAHRLTGMRNLVMAGGVALNCVTNGLVRRAGPFESVWVQPASGDAGGALGAAFLAWHRVLEGPRRDGDPDRQLGSLLGPSYSPDEIGLFLDSVGASYDRHTEEPELLDRVARLIAAGQAVGWFHGRMEYGPRSLGGRSIVGDARRQDMRDTLNAKIKFRESFRPFAPCVLREQAHRYFDVEPGADLPYMQFAVPVRSEGPAAPSWEDPPVSCEDDPDTWRNLPRPALPAVTHVDGSARIQTLDPARHGRFYRLVERFFQLTDCPVIVNTSFNIRGEPIVCTPEDAYRCFMGTGLDALVLEDFLLLKANQGYGETFSEEEYRRRYALD